MRKKDNIEGHYIPQKSFEDMNTNTRELISILNHRLTSLEFDVSWIKKIMSIQTGLLVGLLVAIVGGVIKLIIN
ncbi:MAG: hypothetical protein ACOC5T_01705 [Elusimicrobiota bacterium]